MQLADTSVLITGAGSGLGEATARHFAGLGARIAVVDRDVERGSAVASSIDGVFVECDVGDGPGMEAAFAHVTESIGAPRVVLCCAGIGDAKKVVGRKGPHSLELFDKVIRVNLTGTFNTIRLAAWAMHELDPVGPDGERGVLVATSSVAAFDGIDGGVAYSASKGGVAAMMLPLARDLAAHGIRAVSIAPGPFDTPLAAGMPDDYIDTIARETPQPPRFGHPADFAALAESIVTNPMLNGTNIRLDGGLRMRPSDGFAGRHGDDPPS